MPVFWTGFFLGLFSPSLIDKSPFVEQAPIESDHELANGWYDH
jgi:hypothetical protein